MFRFTFESHFQTQAELREEVANLLWQIDHGIWTIGGMYPNQIGWLKEKVDRSFIKVNGGAKRQSVDVVKDIHQHAECQHCKAAKPAEKHNEKQKTN